MLPVSFAAAAVFARTNKKKATDLAQEFIIIVGDSGWKEEDVKVWESVYLLLELIAEIAWELIIKTDVCQLEPASLSQTWHWVVCRPQSW